MKNLKFEAVLIALALCVVGICICNGLGNLNNNSRTVNVKGLAEMEVIANKVTWPLVVKIVGNDLSNIYQQVNKNNQIVTNFLKEKGISETEITENAPQIVDKEANAYNERTVSNRYLVTSIIIVSTDKVELVRKLMAQQGELLTQGVAISENDYSNSVIYEYTDLNLIKPDMIEQATKNARSAAEKFAKDSDSRLGKIKDAYQGQFSITDRDANTPFIKRVRVVTTVNYYLKD